MRALLSASTRRRTVRVACLLGAGVTLTTIAGCGEKKAKGEGPYAELVAEFVPKIEKETGLPFKTPPKIESRTRDEVGKFVRQQLESERARAQLAGQESAYKLLGMVPDTMNLLALLQKLLEEQIVGYYDPATKVLYVVDGAAPALLRQTVSHELVHALQDQYVKIDSVQAQVDNADRQAAAQAVLEGEAVFLQLRMDPNAGPMLKMPGGWDRIRDAMKDAQTGMPVFSAAPRAVREGLLFPYLGGADFVRRFIEKRPEKELLLDLPISTKQILNDAAYFTDSKATRDLPVAVTLPAPRTGTVVYSNSFGEFETRLMLVQHLKDEALARRGAGGGDGDKFAVIRTADGDALVWATAWDSAVDAADFLDLMGDAARRRYELARIAFPAGATSRQYDVPAKGTRPARTVSLKLEQVNGQPVVIYMDTPAKIGTTLIDLAGITVAR
ncbi:hypothetical protein [Gemmatimonas groenlandica]|uniref:Lipoprotein n=1 Tax=Gemmatimonas groenlandica TaxID=2732249 RepID=A0A6M4IKB0_9BACT|nr:hypothetical protein [Gemmatimonas groenlandica]QJR34495.1 hypothetical protein HKW67_02640 [Gemmatimonas groenlandica]